MDDRSGKDAGTYYVWYRLKGDSAHNDAGPSCVTVQIAKAAQTAPAAPEAEASPASAAAKIKTMPHVHDWEYTAEGSTLTATCKNTDGGHSGETAGTYTAKITLGDAVARVTYTIAPNYALTGQPADDTADIDPKAVTVTAKNQEIEEGAEIDRSVNQAVLEGAIEGHSLSDVKFDADTDNGSIRPYDAVISDAAGNDVTGNYTIAYTSGMLTVNQSADPTPAPGFTGLTDEDIQKILGIGDYAPGKSKAD